MNIRSLPLALKTCISLKQTLDDVFALEAICQNRHPALLWWIIYSVLGHSKLALIVLTR